MMRFPLLLLVAALLSLASGVRLTNVVSHSAMRVVSRAPRASVAMGMEEIEFIIHADGRVEERVRGVKGQDCNVVTEEINKQLGEIYASKPTEEMFEQKVQQRVDVQAGVNVEGGNSKGGGWGQTSW